MTIHMKRRHLVLVSAIPLWLIVWLLWHVPLTPWPLMVPIVILWMVLCTLAVSVTLAGLYISLEGVLKRAREWSDDALKSLEDWLKEDW